MVWYLAEVARCSIPDAGNNQYHAAGRSSWQYGSEIYLAAWQIFCWNMTDWQHFISQLGTITDILLISQLTHFHNIELSNHMQAKSGIIYEYSNNRSRGCCVMM